MTHNQTIEARDLTRYYGPTRIVSELNFVVPRGCVTALLGLNGAGKTTTIRMLMGFLAPTRGTCFVGGQESCHLTPDDRGRIGYMVEGHYLLPWMRIKDYSVFQRAGYPDWDSRQYDAIVEHFGIQPTQRIGQLSRGQRAGVALALTLAARPEILILDDPSLGLDPVSRHALNETILEFAGRDDRTVLLSSHLLDDVERVADRVLVILDGRITVDASLGELTERVGAWRLSCPAAKASAMRSISGVIDYREFGDQYQIMVADPDQDTEAAIHRLDNAAQRVDTTFDEAVISYLSRSRRSTFTPQPVEAQQ